MWRIDLFHRLTSPADAASFGRTGRSPVIDACLYCLTRHWEICTDSVAAASLQPGPLEVLRGSSTFPGIMIAFITLSPVVYLTGSRRSLAYPRAISGRTSACIQVCCGGELRLTSGPCWVTVLRHIFFPLGSR